MTSIPQQCAELRADFIQKGMSDYHTKFCEAMVQSSRMQGDRLFPYEWTGRQVADDMVRQMRMAEMWTATPEMFDLIHHASKSMPPQELRREDLPSPHGFLWLPVPLLIPDIRGKRLRIQGILWSEREMGRKGESPGKGMPDIGRGIVVWMFARMGEKDDLLWNKMGAKDMGRILSVSPVLSLYHSMSVAFGHKTWDVDTSMVDADEDTKAVLARRALMGRRMLSAHDGEVQSMLPDGAWQIRTAEGHVLRAIADPTVQFLAAYFHFAQSELSGLDRTFPPRSTSRWLHSIGMPDSPITVVRLRRRASGQETGRGTALTYRYVRRGFWRNQWYGSGEGRHQRAIWIAPTLVGPEDGPLRIRDVVNLIQH